MNHSIKPVITVFGGTGRQGGGVVQYLRNHGGFQVRVITRNPSKAQGIAEEVVYADLNKPETLDTAVQGSQGVFLVTDYWAQTTIEDWSDTIDEFTQGKAVVEAAKRAGVKHFIWSTLPNTALISNGKFDLPYWGGKAKLDDLVANAGFDYYSFVEAPCYYQNFLKELAPELQKDGTKVWSLPMRPELKAIHMGDIQQMGALVLGALLNPEKVGQGQHMSLSGGIYSWSNVVDIFNTEGHKVAFNQLPDETFDGLFPGAKNVRKSFNYFEAYTYFGPNAEQKITLAKSIATEPLTPLDEWVRKNMPSQ